MVGGTGDDPVASRLSSERSTNRELTPSKEMVSVAGVEPADFLLPKQAAYQQAITLLLFSSGGANRTPICRFKADGPGR